MMRKGLFILFISIMSSFMLVACSEQQVEKEPQFLDVQLTINPEKANPNEPVVFEAKVTYGDEEVTDADEVKFEIWRAHDENHEKIEIEHSEDGIYKLEKSFEREGTYYIYSHVTARGMHNMPKKEFVVGEPSEPEEDSSSSHMDKDEDAETEDHSGH
ncbi:FixH family protein [Cytobacillus sp. FJAT-54145]|uniref:FixH family protein n=1 Tax=Cytobacillus spartinae TaxID=3299023 RepID=A0ABW6KD14_9BACI